MTAWQILGIDPTPDLREIKRAYAKRLKVTRPDDDPQGFQLLRDAYDWAQHWAMHQANPAPSPPECEQPTDAPIPETDTAAPVRNLPWQRELTNAICDETRRGIAVLQTALNDVGEPGQAELEDMLVMLCNNAPALSLAFLAHAVDVFDWSNPTHRHAEALSSLLAGMQHAQAVGATTVTAKDIAEATTPHHNEPESDTEPVVQTDEESRCEPSQTWQRELAGAIDDDPKRGITVLHIALTDVGEPGRAELEDLLVNLCVTAKSLSLGFMEHVADLFDWLKPGHRHASTLAPLLAGMRYAQTAGVAQAAVKTIVESAQQGDQAIQLAFQRALGNEALESIDARVLFEVYLMQWLASDAHPSDDVALLVAEHLEWHHRNLHLRDADLESWQKLAWRLDMAQERRRLHAIARRQEAGLKPEWVKPLSLAATMLLRPYNRLKLQFQALDMKNQMAGAYLIENWQRTHPVLLDEFDSRTVDFYRQDQPHLGEEPIKPIITIGIMATLLAMVVALNSQTPRLGLFLLLLLALFVAGLTASACLPWFWRRYIKPWDERLSQRLLKKDPVAFERGFRFLRQGIQACLFTIPATLGLTIVLAAVDLPFRLAVLAPISWVLCFGTLYWRIRTDRVNEDQPTSTWWSRNWWWVVWVSFGMLRAVSSKFG
ncbi:hypothetical protein HNQ59_000478 [Chitinivorax tropicus]|uniref:J domain-containing protein n=1 Tax=Chitinivorax tropicus TaxID=714531 RepID=A0A840MKY0_9PROT|nr:J domain-containing protein [Chitinivorax tropicus]MBB5017216.1 hypothetical protein [Chitinivorax tropicus]